jgi:HEAT repeat protein
MSLKFIARYALLALVAPPAAHAQRGAFPAGVSAAAVEAAPITLAVVSSLPQDPADSLYGRARATLNNGEYMRAAELFRSLYSRYPRSGYAPESYNWVAFARYRTGSSGELNTALSVLRALERQHPDARVTRDAEVLATRIEGQLAQMGDARAAESLTRAVAPPAAPAPTRPPGPTADAPVPAPSPTPAVSPTPAPSGYAPRPPRADREDDIRITALNALMQMDAERAVPILKQVLERRDEGSLDLRRKAVFLIAQKRTAETEDIMLSVARSDPSPEVRAEAVMWLSQVPTEAAVSALDSILRESDDTRVQERAVFALSQHRSPRAGVALRAYVERDDAPLAMKERAIVFLSQQRSSENQAFLKQVYGRVQERSLKERILMAVAQSGGGDAEWLRSIALNPREDMELRKRALFWMGQIRAMAISDLNALYEGMDDPDMREQLVFVLGQRNEPEAVDVLMKIAEDSSSKALQTRAIFWLGQSKDPRAAEFLLRIINRNP